MNKSLELSAILRRSCEKTRERNLVLFHALLSAVSDVDHSVNDWSHLSNASICAVLRCCLLGSASPRFIFVLGSNAVLLRSPDLGSAWTKIFPIDSHSSALPPAAEEKVAEDDEVSRITQLMSPADGSTTSSIEEDATEARSPPRQQVSCVSAFQDIVAVGGPHGYVALSGNRGMSFTTVPKKIVALGSQEEDFLHISCVDLTHILIATGRRVIRLDIQMDSLGQVSPCGTKLVLTCAGAIGLLTSYSWSSRSRECVVAEPLAMHLSWDAGENFLRVFHALGSIRSVDALTALRRAELPRFGEVSRIYSSAVQGVPTSGEDKTSDNKKSNNNSYEYSSGYTVREGNAVDRLRSLNLHEHFIPSNSTPNMFFRYFMVCGVGTEVINYDYSALLFVGVTVAGNQATVFSVADHVSYIPFTHSGLSEPMACVVQRGPLESKTPIVAVRANSMGVSFSHNFTKWSAPKKGACVGLVPADGGQLVVVGQRNLFSRFQYAESVGEHAMPSSLRVPSVQQVASSV